MRGQPDAAGGYSTAFVGKWDAGMATPDHHPRARGFDSWLGYWHHSNDYWTHAEESCGTLPQKTVRDLWRYDSELGVDGPAKEYRTDPVARKTARRRRMRRACSRSTCSPQLCRA